MASHSAPFATQTRSARTSHECDPIDGGITITSHSVRCLGWIGAPSWATR